MNMKRRILSAAVAAICLGSGAAAVAGFSDYDNNYWSPADRGLWTSDNGGMDQYGVYDNDFNWQTNDTWFNNEVENAQYDYFGYDDAGDAGWFDV